MPNTPINKPSWLARLGQNPRFVGFWAHSMTTAYAITRFPPHPNHLYRIIAAVGVMGWATWKEFWYDAHYEHNPPQTFRDNLEDWLEYLLGSVLGVLT